MKKQIAILTAGIFAVLVLAWLFSMPAAEYAPPDATTFPDTTAPPDDTPPPGVELPPDSLPLADRLPAPGPPPSGPPSEDEEVSPLAQVDRILGTLEEANLAFDTPSEMRWGERRTMELLLSPSMTAADLAQRLDHPTESDTARARVAHRMRATLSGAGFDVEPITPELQAVSYSEITEWKWDVEPTRTGRQQLHLALSALIDVNGETTTRSMRTFSREIEVNVTMTQLLATFVGEHWKWMWAAILVPLAGWGWAWLRARRGIAGDSEPDC